MVVGDVFRRCFIWCHACFTWCHTLLQLLLQECNNGDNCDDDDSDYANGDPGQSEGKGRGKGRDFYDNDPDYDDLLYDYHCLETPGGQSHGRLGRARAGGPEPTGGPGGPEGVQGGPGGSPDPSGGPTPKPK